MINIENKVYFIAKEKSKGILKFSDYNIESKAYIGKNGLTTGKKEGDGKTPIGVFDLGIILSKYKNIKNKNNLPHKQITDDMYWVDDSKSRYYNQLINIKEVEKDWDSAEHLIDYPIQYEYLIEIKTNPKNIPGKGSAIFLHCSNNMPTLGCIAVDKTIMEKIIGNIDQNTKIEIGEKNEKNIYTFNAHKYHTS